MEPKIYSGGRLSLDGVAARGPMSGRGPRRSRGRDGVGTCSDETKPNLVCRHVKCLHDLGDKRMSYDVFVTEGYGLYAFYTLGQFYALQEA